MNRTWNFILLFALLTPGTAFAQDQNATEKKTYADPQAVDRDYAIQGEYAGEVDFGEGKSRLGVQIAALGNGSFSSTVYSGGLPGDGFDGETIKNYRGQRKEDEIVFNAEHAKGVIRDGVLTITNGEEQIAGKLKKVKRKSPTLGMKPPKGAIVLFDGTNADHWKDGKLSDDGLLMQGATSKKKFNSHQLHIEFRLPYCPHVRKQGRGNSGLYLQARYEVQMLDSFGLESKDNDCGGIYSTKAPDLNMCFPPLTWQTYDVDFSAAKFDKDGTMTAKPRVTVKHNGVVIHDDVELPKATAASILKAGPGPGPVFLQDHKNPVRYRNIWVTSKVYLWPKPNER